MLTLLARLVLGAVFLVSAVGKFMDLRSTRSGVREFGVPKVLAAPVAVLLPMIELLIAVALVAASTARVGAIAAVALLAVLSIGIAVNLLAGRTPDCHCFGQLHSAPIGPRMLVRNAVLAGLGVLIIVEDGGPAVRSWWAAQSRPMQVATIEGVAIVLLALAGSAVLWQLFLRYGVLLTRVDRLEDERLRLGDGSQALRPAAPFELGGLYGETISLASLTAKRRPVVLLFSDPHCGPCNMLVPDVGVWQRDHQDAFHLVVVSRGDVRSNLDKFAAAGVSDVLVQRDSEVATAYGVNGTPSAVVISTDGYVEGPTETGVDAIRRRVHALSGARPVPVDMNHANNGAPTHAHANGAPALGDPAPEFELPDRDGGLLALRELRGKQVALVFWNPQCGFCKELEPTLLDWERTPGVEHQETIVISAGLTEEIQGLKFASTVLLDEQFQTAPSFGAAGTPMAIVIDASGRIASEVAVGGPAVMELLATGAS